MITTRFTGNINSFEDNWNDIKHGPVMNIRVAGTYPRKHHNHCCHHQHNPHPGFCILPCFNQHKPYGIATVHIDFGDDDRPDWYKFNAKKQRRQFEEIMPEDQEFHDAIHQDHDLHMRHDHVHLKPIEPNTESEEIEDDVIL